MSRLLRSRFLFRVLHRRSEGRSSFSSSSAAAGVPVGDQPSPTPPTPPSSSAAGDVSGSTPPAGAKKPWGLLKFGALAAFSGAVGAIGYVTYAYALDEVDQRTSTLRSMSKHPLAEDASGFEKFRALVYSTTMKVPVKAIELYLDARRAIEEQVKGFTEPSSDKLLPDLLPQEQNVLTLVLDLNETLVYSDWKRERGWRTFKRPGVDAFLEHLAKFYEIVVYSDQLPMYADAVLDRLDQKQCIRYRLTRAATRYLNGKHYRDLSKLNRDPSQILYISGHALESSLQPENCVPIKPWKLENDDTALLDLIPFLEYVAVHRPADIRAVLASYKGHDIATEFIERSKEYQKRMQEQKQQRSIWWR